MNAPSKIEASNLTVVAKYQLTMRDYMLLHEAGSLTGRETELIDGDVIIMSPEWIPHMRIKDELAYRLRRALEERDLHYVVGTGGSVALSEVDLPRPDVMVLRSLSGDRAVPREAVLLVVEVSSTTLTFDLTVKAAIYARCGIAEYWVVDVNGRLIHLMSQPVDGSYLDTSQIAFGEPVTSATMTNLVIDTTGL